MSDFEISERMLDKEAESIAKEAMAEVKEYGGDVEDLIWQRCDGHEWVIYNYKALKLVTSLNTDQGESWLEDIGIEPTTDIYKLASQIAFGTLSMAAMDKLAELTEEVAA